MTQPSCVGVLLAGGAARRFGGVPKGLAIVNEVRIADRVLGALRAVTDTQIVVSNDAMAATWFPSLRVFRDAEPGLGPLAGIETALRAAAGASIMIIAWDMPFVPVPLLRGMRALGEAGAAAVVPAHGASPTYESLCAFYAADALAVATSLLATGERRASALRDALPDAVTIPERVLVEHGEPERLFLSVDSLAQLEALGGTLP